LGEIICVGLKQGAYPRSVTMPVPEQEMQEIHIINTLSNTQTQSHIKSDLFRTGKGGESKGNIVVSNVFIHSFKTTFSKNWESGKIRLIISCST
jgi:hypothetical protein